MTEAQTHEVTQLLIDWSNGDHAALDKLIPVVDAELRRLAHRYMRRERADHTLQTTALVNEAFVRLVHRKSVQWQNRAHFFGIAAQLMRTILVDHARSHACAKRGGGAGKLDDIDLKDWPSDGYLLEIPVDGWGREFVYRTPGTSGRRFDLFSLGEDPKNPKRSEE